MLIEFGLGFLSGFEYGLGLVFCMVWCFGCFKVCLKCRFWWFRLMVVVDIFNCLVIFVEVSLVWISCCICRWCLVSLWIWWVWKICCLELVRLCCWMKWFIVWCVMFRCWVRVVVLFFCLVRIGFVLEIGC